MKTRFLVIAIMMALCSIVFSNALPAAVPQPKEVGGAMWDPSMQEYFGPLISGDEIERGPNGYVKFDIKNKTGRGATDFHVKIWVVPHDDGTPYVLQIVTSGCATSCSDNANGFDTVTVTDNESEFPTVNFDQQDCPPTPLPNNGTVHVEIQVKKRIATNPDMYISIQKTDKVYASVHWTTGLKIAGRTPIVAAKTVEETEEVEPTTDKQISDNVETATSTATTTGPKTAGSTEANDEANQTTILLNDFGLAFIDIPSIQNGTLTIPCPEYLEFDITDMEVIALPFKPYGVPWPEDYEGNKNFKYPPAAEDGGAFVDPDFVTFGLTASGDLAITFDISVSTPAPWESEILKFGCFIVRDLKIKIGGEGEVWTVGDKIKLGISGDPIGNLESNGIFHVITIVE